MTRFALICAALLLSPLAAQAQSLTGTRAVFLEDSQGNRTHIADLRLDAEGRYAVDMQDGPFTDHFLSMRPFKCLEGAQKHWCHVPYPYEIARQVSPDDLTDLEYDFLFLWKGSTDYGIDMWNGVYYRLEAQDGRLVGRLHEMDMGMLAVPPAQGVMRPVRDVHLEESDPGSHWLPVLVIE